MRNGGPSTSLLDWLSISLRWLTLFGVTISLAFGGNFSLSTGIPLFVAALWNIWLTVWVTLKERRLAPRSLTVAVDMLVAYTLFYISGTLGGGLGWVGILPLISAALFFGLKGAGLVALVNLIVQGGLSLLSTGVFPILLLLATFLPLYVIAGLVFGFIGQQMIGIIQRQQLSLWQTHQEAQRVERERSRAIYNLVSTLSSSLNYQRVLETALDLSASALGEPDFQHDQLVSGVLLFTNNDSGKTHLRVGSARRFTPADMRITLPGRRGLIGQAIDGGDPMLTNNIDQDPELGRFVALRSCRAAYCLPLHIRLDTYGVLLFGHPDEDYFTPERTEILDVIANQAVIAIQNAQLYRDLELEKERILEIQEEARRKLARDLHDGPTQSVAAIAMRVNYARRMLERDAKAAADEMFKVEDLARLTAKEIRHMLFTLRPLVLESQGLVAALESMADKMRDTYGQNVIISAEPDIVDQLEMNKQAVIFFIVEEAVTNARKHAQAENIWVRLSHLETDLVLLEVEDDGVGFDKRAVEEKYENRGSLGMVNMRERVELVGGHLQVDSAKGQGTCISIVIPLTEEAVERVRHGL